MKSEDGGREERPCLIFGALPVGAEELGEALAGASLPPYVIAADAGWRQASALGYTPDLALGDFDSSARPKTGGEEPEAGELLVLPAEKDDTDLHFAAKEALGRGFRQVCLLGALGGRPDQTLASLATLLHLCRAGAKASLLGPGVRAYCIPPGQPLALTARENCYLSVFPAEGRATGVFEKGVKYPLVEATLEADYPLGVSNEFAAPAAEISSREGALFVFLVEKDADYL